MGQAPGRIEFLGNHLDYNGGEVLGGLRLRTGLVTRDEQKRAIHDGGAVEHGRHENIVPWAVDEGHVPHEGHLLVLEPRDGARRGVGHRAAVRAVAVRPRARVVFALVDLRVCVAELDRDVAFELVLEADGLDAGDGLDDGGLTVRDVADGTWED